MNERCVAHGVTHGVVVFAVRALHYSPYHKWVRSFDLCVSAHRASPSCVVTNETD
jgi:hypothetical protein